MSNDNNNSAVSFGYEQVPHCVGFLINGSMYDDIHVMQYLGERATFSMIARNDEMRTKRKIFRNRESLFA